MTQGSSEVQAKDVVLIDAGPNPPMVADVVRALTGADYATARDLVGRAPCTVRARIAPALAEALQVRLTAAGAHAEVRDHAAAPAAVPEQAPAAAREQAPASEGTCDVFLRDYGSRKVAVIKVVKDTLQLGLRESLELVDGAPRVVAHRLGRDRAEVFVHELVEAGARAELRAHAPEPARPLASTIVTRPPAPTIVNRPVPTSGGAAQPASSSLFEVILNGCGPNKINVVKIIRERTGLGLKESKDLAESTDVTIRQGIAEDEAVALMRELAAVGASVEVRGAGGAPAAASGSIEASCDVVMIDCGAGKIAVIKLIRELTFLGLKEAKDIAETPGSTIKAGVPGEEAREIERKFAAAGAKVELVAHAGEGESRDADSEEVDVVLQDCGPNKISVIKEVRTATGLGLKETKDLVESAPATIKEAVPVGEAIALKQRLVEVGAHVKLV